ncbi:MAG: hypothetical protein JHD16_00655 [Solirubrobacteraceae bacterium]|nr:hypothetical protein [Solirubrobacteraceae bacterium]
MSRIAVVAGNPQSVSATAEDQKKIVGQVGSVLYSNTDGSGSLTAGQSVTVENNTTLSITSGRGYVVVLDVAGSPDRIDIARLSEPVGKKSQGGLDLREFCTTAELADDAGPGINEALAELRGTPLTGPQGGRLWLPNDRLVVQTQIDYDRLSGVTIEGQGCGVPFRGTGSKAVGTVLENQTGGAAILVRRSQTNANVTRTTGVLLDKFTIENPDNTASIGIDITAPQGRIKLGHIAVSYGLVGIRIGDPDATSFTQSPFDLDADWLYLDGSGPDGSVDWAADDSAEALATVGLLMRDYGYLSNFHNVVSRYWGRCVAHEPNPAIWATAINFWGGMYEAAKQECMDLRNIRQVNLYGTHAEGASESAAGDFADIILGEADSDEDSTEGLAMVTANLDGVTFAGSNSSYRIEANRFAALNVKGCHSTTNTQSGAAIKVSSDGFGDVSWPAQSSVLTTDGNAFYEATEVDVADYDGRWIRRGSVQGQNGFRRADLDTGWKEATSSPSNAIDVARTNRLAINISGGATLITDFTNGADGQALKVRFVTATDVNTTGNITPCNGVRTAYRAGQIVDFVNVAGEWYEQGARPLKGTAAFAGGAITDGSTANQDVTVTGAQLGDPVACGCSGLDETGWDVTGYVRAADTVRIRMTNRSGGSITIPASTVWASVDPGWRDV